MALGGGTFVVQNKKLPGAYINFVSAASASATLSERGIATMPLELDWGVDGEIFEVTNGDFQKNTLKIFGYGYTHEKMKGLRDLFQNTKTLYAYKLTSGGTKASNTFAEALYSGVRGNDVKIVIQKNADNEKMFDVKTVLDGDIVDEQTVEKAAELVANDFVKFKTSATLAVTAATPLAGGTNGTVNGTAYQKYLDKIRENADAAVTQSASSALAAAMADPEKYIHDNKEMLEQYRAVAESEEYKASPACRLQEYLKQFQSESGYNDVFIPTMQRLSPAYREYHKSLQAANEVFLRHFQQE